MASTLLQWNVRGIRANYIELKTLISNLNPIVVCLQETLLSAATRISFKSHSLYSTFATNIADRPTGGVTLIVNNSYPQSPVPLVTNLQACAVRVSCFKQITVCSIYIQHGYTLRNRDLVDLINQLPEPFILMGDFNGHNILWGCRDTDSRGSTIETFILNNNLCLLNNNKFTRVDPATGSRSALDLTLCSPSLVQEFFWDVLPDLHGSDHFPVLLRATGRPNILRPQRWKLHKADWSTFSRMCEEQLTPDRFDETDDPVAEFTTALVNIANQSVPKTSTNPKRFNKPWFNEQCKAAIKKRKRLLRVFCSQPTQENLSNFRIARASARRVLRQSQRESWRQYVSRLNAGSSIKSTWDRIRKIRGKGIASPLKHLQTDNGIVEEIFDISNAMGEAFAKCSSSDNYTASFRAYKSRVECNILNFGSGRTEEYNELFTIKELSDALHRAHDTAVGPDDVHYQFLKHLPSSSLQTLLDSFNRVWVTGAFPAHWRQAIVIPVPKPGKDHSLAVNYRPIALTSCICKTMERMVNSRLVWLLETGEFFTKFQSGFRQRRSTVDHLIGLESCIREAFANRQHLVGVFFDLEKAYDTTWKYGILRDLQHFGLRGRMTTFISRFLEERQFRVRLGSTLSDHFDQEMGVPQGSILSVTLFTVKINNIVKQVVPGVECFLYVDDFTIVCRSANMRTIERKLQLTLNNLSKWTDESGFKFSQSKTVCVHFCNQRKLHNDPELMLGNTIIPVIEETKFLGVTFDRKLNFTSHLRALKAKCSRSLNILKVVANTDWGADRKVLLRMYRSLVRSKLDYGSVVYGSARRSYLQMLDPVHHQGIRLCLGAFRTSPVESLYVEANEPSLYRRRERLTMHYSLGLRSNPDNPSYDGVFSPKYVELFAAKPTLIPTFGIRAGQLLAGADINLEGIAPSLYFQTPPWKLKTPSINFTLTSLRKGFTSPTTYRCRFAEVLESFQDSVFVFTDGSKTGDLVGCAAVALDREIMERLPRDASIFSAELRAIDLAVDYVIDNITDRVVIFSDSLSVLQALHNLKTDNPLVVSVLDKLNSCPKEIMFCWIPSHVGITGNEKADLAAKSALNLPISPQYLPFSDFKPNINRFVMSKWQDDWTNTTDNKLRVICDSVVVWPFSTRTLRREEAVLARIRIGHSHVTHVFLLKREQPPDCNLCQLPLTVRHILGECCSTRRLRERYFKDKSLPDLFGDQFGVNRILAFLRTTGYFKLI